MFDPLLSLIAPHQCLQCGVEGTLWCMDCREAVPPAIERCYRCHALSARSRTCASCRLPSPLYSVQAATRYEGHAKRLIWRFKFERAKAAVYPITAIMERHSLASESLIVPVPTSTNRVRQRGYDQTVLIARRFSLQRSLPYHAALMRLGRQQQHTATRAQRLSQLAQAFIVPRPGSVNGKHVVLVDDVITTGATLEAAARALKLAGAKRVSAIVFAQA